VPRGGAQLDLRVGTCIAGWRDSAFYRVLADQTSTHWDLYLHYATEEEKQLFTKIQTYSQREAMHYT